MACRVHYLVNEETCEIQRAEEHAAPVPEVRAERRVNRVMMLMIFCVHLVTGLISLSVYNFIKLNHKEQELEELRNANYILTSKNTELQEIRDILQSQLVTLNEKLDELTKEFNNLQERVDKETSEWKRNNNNLQERLATLQSSQDMLKSECFTNYSNLQESLNILQSQYETLNEKLDELTKAFSNLKEFYCDVTNTSPDNTCSLCKPGGIFFNSKCYFISTYEQTWKQSRDWCMTRGGRLVNIETVEERDFIKSKARSYYWIGGYDISKENNSTRMGAEPVKSKRPSDVYKGECILIDLQMIKVYNHRCRDSHQWICESAAFPLHV